MNRRILVNLTVFLTLGGMLTFWAFQNVVKFDVFERPYHLTVEFASSPGLHPNFEVDYLGLKVGKIDSVRLRNGKVVVVLDIDRGIRIPQGVHAAAARKSAVGEPVVELTPAPGRGNAPPMEPGSVIPIQRTSVPPAYSDLFGAVNKAVGAIDPADVRVLTSELAIAWNGRADSLRQIIGGTDQLTTTFAQNGELLDGLTKDLSRITRVLAENRGDLAAGVDDLAALIGALSDVRGELTALRDQGPGLIGRLDTLLMDTRLDLDCSLAALGDFFPRLAAPAYLENLRATLTQSPQLGHVLNNIISRGEDGDYTLRVMFMITANTPATLEYKYPLPQPEIPKPRTCAGGRTPGKVAQKSYVGARPGDTFPTHDPAVNRPERARKTATEGTPGGPPAWLIYLPPVIALLVLIKVVAGTAPVLARRRRKR
ncbi:virulence factor Mce family protein [Actinomadura craniellae]|uniref:Virulence factor Mce family protein n=1 Tax=Actinomadura craniellae TaxID=2231787 RepID=A0A365HA87_9ACTN|nr:MCE family protein [Actinomadura craniellae]RAY15846.1 virulence factor Mce family protein [Actinomadura craniellae]